MVPKLKEHNIGGGLVRNYFCRHSVRGVSASVFAVEESLPATYKRSGQIEGMSCWIKEPIEDSRVALVARDSTELDPVSVARIKRLVAEVESGWIDAVRKAARQTSVLEEIAWESEIYELNAVQAIVSILIEVGELPPIEAEDYGEE